MQHDNTSAEYTCEIEPDDEQTITAVDIELSAELSDNQRRVELVPPDMDEQLFELSCETIAEPADQTVNSVDMELSDNPHPVELVPASVANCSNVFELSCENIRPIDEQPDNHTMNSVDVELSAEFSTVPHPAGKPVLSVAENTELNLHFGLAASVFYGPRKRKPAEPYSPRGVSKCQRRKKKR